MVTTTKAPSKASAVDKAAPKKTTVTKPVVAKQVLAKSAVVAPVTTKIVASTPVAVKPVAVQPTEQKAPAAKTKLMASTAPKPVLSSEQRTHYVAVAAFYIAEQRGFTLGNPVEDWIAAESEVDRLISSGHFTL